MKSKTTLFLIALAAVGTLLLLTVAAAEGQGSEEPPATPPFADLPISPQEEKHEQNEQTVSPNYKERIEEIQMEHPAAPLALLAAGGPDAFGYTFKDSAEPDGPAYNFEDISGTGTAITLGDDQVSTAIPLGFPFNYYGADYTDIYVSSNGFLTVLPGQGSGCCTGQPLPQGDSQNGVIAGWWGDLWPPGGAIHYQTLGIAPNRTFIVQFTDVPHCCSVGNSPVTLQYKLFEDTNVIEVHYQAAPSSGGIHSAGIENETGTIGLQYYLSSVALSTPLAVRYEVSPNVILIPPSAAGGGVAGSTVVYTETVTNLTEKTDNFTLTLSGNAWPTVLSISNTGVISDGASVDFTVQVDIPPGAALGDSDIVTVTATSMLSPTTYSATATIQTVVPGDLAYVTLSGSDRVALVDTISHIVVGNVDVGAAGCDFPWRATMSPAGDHVYVSCYSSGNVAVIETTNNTVVTTVLGIPNADGIAFTRDSAHALVGSRWYQQIAVVDTATHAVNSYIPTPSYVRSVAAHPYLDVAYATCGNGTILVVDTTTFSIVTAIPVSGEPWDVAVSPDGRWVFTGDRWGAGLAVIPVGGDAIYTTVTGLGSLTGLEVAPDGSKVYASSPWNGVRVIDGVTFNLITTITGLQNLWEAAVSCDGSELYVTTGRGNNQVPVIDTATSVVTDQITLPGSGAQGVAICPQPRLPGLYLYPVAQSRYDVPGESVVYSEYLANATGQTDSFDLALSENTWDTNRSLANTGPLDDGDWISFTVQVTIPVSALPGDADTATIQATSITSPTVYSATTTITTTAICTPNLTFTGQSAQTYGDLDDTYGYGGQKFIYVNIHGFSGDNDTLDATISGYDPGSDTWQPIAQQWNGGGGVIADQFLIPPTYTRLRVQLDDTEDNDLIYYDYRFIVCREPAVVLSPPSQQDFVQPGTTAVYTQTMTNYMMTSDSFDLLTTGNSWPTTFWDGSTPISNTGELADQETFSFTVRVEVPAGASVGVSDTATIQAVSVASPAISDTATVQTLIPGDLAYVTLSNSDLVALVDTASHLVAGSVDVGAVGCDFPWRATMSPAGDHVYVSCYSYDNVAVIETANNTVVTTVLGISNADGIAFTRDGAHALVGSRSSSYIFVVDTATYSTTFIPTPSYPRSIAAHPGLDVAYATSADGSILVVDTTSFTVTTVITTSGNDPWDVVVSSDGQWVFAGDRWGAGLDVIDTGSNTVYTTVTGLGSLTGLEVAPDGSKVYVSNLSNGVHVIDGATFSRTTTVGSLGSAWEVAATCDGSELYVGNTGNYVPVIDTATSVVTAQISMPGNEARGIAICPQRTLVLSITKTGAQNPVEAGDLLTYTIVVENHGNINGTGVTISDTIPVSTTFASADSGGSQVGDQVRWTGLTATTEADLVVHFAVTVGDVPSGTLITNDDYGVTCTEGASAIGDAVTTMVQNLPALSISKTGSPDPVQAGELLTYTIAVKNSGSINGTGVIISDTVPVSTTFASADSGGNQMGDQVRWTGLTATTEADLVVHFAVTVGDVPSGTLITNDDYGVTCAEGVSAVGDAVTTTVQNFPALSISKTGSPDPVQAGELLTYTIAVKNSGSINGTGVIISDTVPVSTTFASADSGGNQMGDQVHWTGLTATVETDLVVHFAVTVGDVPSGTLITNDDYGVTCAEGVSAAGSPVTTTVTIEGWQIYLPLVVRNYSAGG